MNNCEQKIKSVVIRNIIVGETVLKPGSVLFKEIVKFSKKIREPETAIFPTGDGVINLRVSVTPNKIIAEIV